MTRLAWFPAVLVLVMVFGCGDDGGSGTDPESTPAACQDDIDNDGDGLTDCDDPDCRGLDLCQVVTCDVAPCDEHATCDDSDGAAVCTCDPGWEGNGETCTDVDECTGGTDDCEQTCLDTAGGYTCGCEAGYTLDVDGHSCDLVDCGPPDAPASGTVDLPDGTTVGAVATYGCDPGFYLSGDAERSCDTSGLWSGEAPACNVCDVASMNDCLCEGAATAVHCVEDSAVTCDLVGGTLVSVEACSVEHCLDDLGCQVCLAGELDCFGNEVRSCNAVAPASWETIEVCAAPDGYRCDAAQGTCVVLSDIGSVPDPITAFMYHYGSFEVGSSTFLGGFDVASYGDYLYVHGGAQYATGRLDVYEIELLDSDGDGLIEPEQHPEDPNHEGPIEQRVLTLVASYDTGADGLPEGENSFSELHADADRIFMVGAPDDGAISDWDFATHTSSVVVDPVTDLPLHNLGHGSVDGLWYGASPFARLVYSFHAPTREWVAEFLCGELSETHISGLEVVVDPSTNVPYVYVADLAADYLGQFRRDGLGGWVQENVFMIDAIGLEVNGMGFGALDHFWVTSGDNLDEVGGGDLTEYLE